MVSPVRARSFAALLGFQYSQQGEPDGESKTCDGSSRTKLCAAVPRGAQGEAEFYC